MSVVDKIQHYQRSLERCTDNRTRTLHCIEKLYRLPVTVQHLQETGVGRTVNALRKYDGSIGDAAKALVAKWKTMVVDEDTSECDDDDEACAPDARESYSDHSSSSKSDENDRDESSRNSSKHRSSESRDKSRNSEKHESRHGTKNSSSENSKPRENETKTTKENDERHKSAKNRSEKKQSKSEEKSSKSTARESKHETSSKRESMREDRSHRGSSSTSSTTVKVKTEEERKSSSRVSSSSGNGHHSGTSKNRSKSRDSQRKRKLDSSSSERETSKKNKSLESPDDAGNDIDDNRVVDDDDDDDDDDDRPTQILLRDSDNESGKNQPDTCFDSDSDDEILKKKIKREMVDSPSTSERGGIDSRNAPKMEKSSKVKSRENTDKSSSNTSGKSRRDDEKRERSKTEGETSGHRKNEKRKDDATRDQQAKESSSKSKSHTKSSSSSSKHHHHTGKDKDELRKSSKSKKNDKSDRGDKDSSEKFKEPKDKKVKKKKMNEDDGIDCNSGASFAEALGMCLDRPSSRKKNPVSPTSPLIKTIKTEPGTSSSSPMPSSSKSSHPIKSEFPSSNDSQALSLLAPNVKLEPLNVDLASTLPEISPNYKPLPAHYTNPLHRKQDEDKALSDVIYAKGQRTKVYSGNKSGYTSVPSLCEVCIRVLIQHMDALGFTGGIPYDILKPVLERAMPDQLFTLENYNPYLIEDTDSLWQFHCNREFREKQREEMESWRDMYMRCRDEREVKLKALTANIKESIDKSVPVRSTKMAYVDNFVKPPRNVLRNQARYGTAKSSTSSSDLKKKLILSGGGNSATNIAVPPPPMSRMKTSSSSNGKKNKAPLMAKALQLIKSRYKR